MNFVKTDDYKKDQLSQMYRVTARRKETFVELGRELIKNGITYRYDKEDKSRDFSEFTNDLNMSHSVKMPGITLYILIWNDGTFCISQTFIPGRVCMNYITMKEIQHFVKLVKEELQ